MPVVDKEHSTIMLSQSSRGSSIMLSVLHCLVPLPVVLLRLVDRFRIARITKTTCPALRWRLWVVSLIRL